VGKNDYTGQKQFERGEKSEDGRHLDLENEDEEVEVVEKERESERERERGGWPG